MPQQLDNMSMPGAKSELDLFSLPPTQVAVDSGYWSEVRPSHPVNNQGPYDFKIEREPTMVDLNKNYLYLKFKVVKADGTNMAADVDISPINLFAKTFIKQAILKISDKEAFNSGSSYAYQAYLETVLNYGWAAKASHLQNCFFYQDDKNQFDAKENSGHAKRKGWTKQSAAVELMAPLHCDLFAQERYMLPNTTINLTLYRNSDEFCLQAFGDDPAFRIEILDMRWYVRKVKVQESLSLAIEDIMTTKRMTAKYPIRRVKVINRLISKGSTSSSMDAMFTGQLPRRIVFGLVSSKAYYGNIKKSPFNFQHYKVKEIVAWLGDRQVPAQPIRTDYANFLYAMPYMLLHEGSGIGTDDRGLGIGLADFAGGNTIYVLDLTPDQSDSASLQLLREGSLSLDIQFAEAISEDTGVQLIVYAEFDNLITLDHNRSLFFDYSL